MTWVVGEPMVVGVRLLLNDVEVATGTVTAVYWRNNAGAIEFLQSNGTSWGATAHNFSCPYDSDVGFANLSVNAPTSVEDNVVHYEVSHSVYGLIASGEHLVEAPAEVTPPELTIVPD